MSQALEIAGAVLGLAYLVLAVARRWWAWIPYILSSAVYFPVFWASGFAFNALLQLFFIGMGFHGLSQWRQEGEVVAPVRWPAARHAWIVTVSLALSALLGWVAAPEGPMAVAFADSTITVCSIVATYLTVKRVLENWAYWLLINALAACTFAAQGLTVTACLYGAYGLLCVSGLIAWRRAAPTVNRVGSPSS